MPGAVALTGATGFIGSALCKALVESGYQVRALTRKPRPPSDNVVWVPGDLGNPPAVHALLEGAHTIIHCAGTVRGKSRAEFDRVNVEGTRGILSATRAHVPPPRLLFISSLAARSPELSWYAASKAAAEALIRDQGQDLSWTILRPTAVYGPGDREMRPLFQWLLRGVLPAPQPAGGRFSLLHVDDLIAAVLQWLRQPQGENATFELCDGTADGYDAETVARLVETHRGSRVCVLRLPPWLLRMVAGINLCLARASGGSPMLTPGKVRELTHPDWTADAGRFSRVSGWSPRIRFQDALEARRLFFT